MQTDPKLIIRMLNEAAKQAGVGLEHGDLQLLAEKIGGGMEQKYLYETKTKAVKAVEGNQPIGLSRYKLDEIAKYLSFNSFQDYKEYKDQPPDEQLISLAGNWKSVVRFSSRTEGWLLVSPVKIYVDGTEVKMQLKGPGNSYLSKLTISNGNIFGLLEGPAYKQLHLVFKIGKRKGPLVLKGVFSGVSTAGEPIGGRELLIRMPEEDFDSMKNQKISIAEALESPIDWIRKAGNYLKDFNENNLQIGQVNSFGLEDL